MSENSRDCGKCFHWSFFTTDKIVRGGGPIGSRVGYCRRYPPQRAKFLTNPVRLVESLFPLTNETEICGEWLSHDAGLAQLKLRR